MSEKPYKALGIDLRWTHGSAAARKPSTPTSLPHQIMEGAQLADPDAGPKAFQRLRAAVVNDTLARHLKALDAAMMENETLTRDISRCREVAAHLAALRQQAAEAAGKLREAEAEPAPRRPSAGPSA